MKKHVIIILSIFLMSACNKQQELALKSADKALILKQANKNFEKKKWRDALALYDRLPNLVAGTDDAPNVVFNSAYANYYDKNYKLAGNQFKNFSRTFLQDSRKEEAAYMSALCFYEGSMDYNLDQTSTESSINELQDFLNNYPKSERSKNINELIDELSYKLEFKSYQNAKQYYKMADYKAANVAFENVLNDFPATKLRPQIYNYIMKSRYELAMHSIYDLKKERLDNAISYSKQIEKELPNSDNAKTVMDYREKLVDEEKKFKILQEDVEKRKIEISKKMKEEEAIQNEKQNEKKQIDRQKEAMQTARDSAKLATPPSSAIIKIK